ncbi:hypothetical protein BDV24DRAFT_169297 [Aspergillus arachidicola]|uniref:Xylanolytic transcriptional activator regulatory domain-containing protein n=1 Tax=Aspergillus arachidicola TaxID=656916 RepID=A0A5N6XQ74_9EURO|nr:hypothetical protein BDV24DRAFT_169297 [Aspergillus arachidicola]
MCVRIAYNLGLSEIGDNCSFTEHSDATCRDKELHRRAWWLVWELDAFGSSMMRRPFAIDRRHRVHLPVSDDDWFSDRLVRSAPVQLEPAKSLFSLAIDQAIMYERVTIEKETASQNDVACFGMVLPPSSRQFLLPTTDLTSAQRNWIVGTQILLTATLLIATQLTVRLPLSDRVGDPVSSDSQQQMICISRLSAVLRDWPPGCVTMAHPFLSCALFPCGIKTKPPLELSEALSSYNDLVGLIQSIFARNWPLGSIASCM